MHINERSSALINDFTDKVFHILGCGAIGSSAATQLCRMGGETFVLYDLDSVEIQNVGVSHYTLNDIGKRANIDTLKESNLSKTSLTKDHIQTGIDILTVYLQQIKNKKVTKIM